MNDDDLFSDAEPIIGTECPDCGGAARIHPQLRWGGGEAMTYPYVYVWRNNRKRMTLYGRRCRILARGTMNSRLIEFDDGQRENVSGNSLRKAT